MLKKNSAGFYFGLAIIAGVVLALQILHTRFLSISSYYSLAFFAISMAMLGLTTGAIYVYFKKDWLDRFRLDHLLSSLSNLVSLAILLSLTLYLTSLVFVESGNPLMTFLVWGKLVVILAIPYFVSGILISLALTKPRLPIGYVYGSDLIGAAIGCFMVLGLLAVMDGVSAVLALAALSSLAGVLFRNGLDEDAIPRHNDMPLSTQKRLSGGGLLTFFALAALCVANAFIFPNGARIFVEKGRIAVPAYQEAIFWNSFSRVDMSPPFYNHVRLHGIGRNIAHEDLPKTVMKDLKMDADAATIMLEYKAGETDVSFLEHDVVNVAYSAAPDGKAAVIGVGGGRDVLSALHFGHEEVIGVEINPIFVENLEGRSRDFNQVADVPGVQLVVDEARAWFASTDERFASIQMSLIDTWAATGVGAFSLTENGLYTIEGWTKFLSKLEDGGVFSVSRWFSPKNIGEAGRTVSLAKATLYELGASNPDDHIMLVSASRLATIVVGRDPLTDAQIAAIEDLSAREGFDILYTPKRQPENDILNMIRGAGSVEELNSLAKYSSLNFAPPTDSAPFFFNQLQPSSLLKFGELKRQLSSGGGVVPGNITATLVLIFIICLSTIAVIATAVIPSRAKIRNVSRTLSVLGTSFFLCIGLGFMFVEIALMQRLSIFLGHPVYGLAVALAGIILATGIGSLISERFQLNSGWRLTVWSIGTAVYLAATPIWLPAVVGVLDTSSILVRCAASLVIILPAGILLGFGFPTGMRLVNGIDATPTPWFWAVNGAAGVLASGVAVFIGTTFSINTNFVIAALCYAAIAPLVLGLNKFRPEKAADVSGSAQAT